MEQQLTNFLIQKYDPTGIILYGSRVTGNATPYSDWDIFVFTDKTADGLEDYYQHSEWNGEALEINIYPSKVADDFILDSAMHPVRDMKILFDRSGGLLEQIITRTQEAYAAGPKPLTFEQKQVYKKIITKFVRKIQSRPDDAGHVLFGVGQLYIYAVRYWFEMRSMWPLPIYEATRYITEHDKDYANLLDILTSRERTPEEKYEAGIQICTALFGE